MAGVGDDPQIAVRYVMRDKHGMLGFQHVVVATMTRVGQVMVCNCASVMCGS